MTKEPAKGQPDWIKAQGAARTARIDITDNPANAVLKLVGDDRASAASCIAMIKAVAQFDPKAEFGPFTPLLILQEIGLIGPDIGLFYGLICRRDPLTALALLHAARLKLLSAAMIRAAIAGGPPIDDAALLHAVRSRMPDFGPRS